MNQYRTFKVGITEKSAEELNRFLRTHTIVSIEKNIVLDGESSFYIFLVEYQSEVSGNGYERKQKKDWSEGLNEKQMAAYVEIKEYRNGVAKNDGVPPFALFGNEIVAKMTKLESFSKGALKTINGFGDAKLSKYGDTILEILTKHLS